jgi:hypothetical protein
MKLTGPPFWFRATRRFCRRPGSLSLSFAELLVARLADCLPAKVH